jgi:hypothetical protein
MIGERTNDGWEIRLRTRDPGRYVGAAFLLFWLCGWAVGEGFALGILIKGALALLTGTPPGPGRAPLAAGPSVAAGAFLLIWLTFWTVGGIAAIGELLRLLWGVDRMVVAGGRLTVISSRGPFRTVRAFDRDTIRRVSLLAPRDHLALETGTRHVTLSRLGTRAERAEAAAALSTELALGDSGVTAGSKLPDRWEQIVTPEGDRALVSNLSARRSQARVAGVVAMAAATVTLLFAVGIARDPRLVLPALLGLIVTSALVAGAVWLARGRWEWRIGSGRLTLRKRFGSTVRDVFEAGRLVLDSSSDSDGDVWYTLCAVREEDRTPQATHAWRPTAPKNSRAVARLMNDAPTLRALAAWLAGQADLALEDRTPPEARTVDLAKLRQMLENSGRFGRWAAKLMGRLGERERKAG